MNTQNTLVAIVMGTSVVWVLGTVAVALAYLHDTNSTLVVLTTQIAVLIAVLTLTVRLTNEIGTLTDQLAEYAIKETFHNQHIKDYQ